jgi:hypothetical protein
MLADNLPQGILLPSIEDIDSIDIRGAGWALIVEKEVSLLLVLTAMSNMFRLPFAAS